MLKIMKERDLLMNDEDDGKNKLYVVTPTPMMEWMQAFVDDQIQHKANIVLVPSKELNPEKAYYYQNFGPYSYRDVKKTEALDSNDTR